MVNMPIEPILVNYAADKLAMYCGRIETCVDKLTPEQIWIRNSDNANAIGNLMLHLSGNVRQWILHGVGGQADLRQRDSEFAAREGAGAEELLAPLRATVEEAVALFRALPEERLLEHIHP